MKWHEIVPIVSSIILIVLVAVLERQSKMIAAITATMPVTMPLALWIVYSSNQGERIAITKFTGGLLIGIIPTFAFVIAVWAAARAGFKLVPILVVGYTTWAVILTVILVSRRILGSST